MPSETMNLQSLSSPSFFSEDTLFPTERQVGFLKPDTVLDQRACKKPVTLSTMEKIIPVESQSTRYLEHTEPFTKQLQKVNLRIDRYTVGAERVSNQSLKFSEPSNQCPGTKLSFNGENGFCFAEGNQANKLTSQYENSLFSSSFSELFTRRLRLSSNNAIYGHSVDTLASHYEEEEPFESLEELEAQTIGNLLPDDDDLFSGVSGGLDFGVQPNVAEETEELDVFSSVGGMDLDDHDPTVGRKNSEFLEESHLGLFKGLVAGEHPCAGKQNKVEPSLPGDLRKCSVQQLPSEEQDECCSYEHPRSSSNDATLAFSVSAVGPNSLNNMDNGTSSGVNSAIQALFLESTIHHGISSSVSNSLTSTVRVESMGNRSVIAESGQFQGQMKFDVQGAPAFHPRSLPEYQNGLSRGVHCNYSGPMAANIYSKPLEIIDNKPLSRISSSGHSFEFSKAGFPPAGNGSHLLPGHHYSLNNSYHPQPPSMLWSNSPSLANGTGAAHPPAQLHGLPIHMLNTGVPINNHHVGSAPAIYPSLWDRRHAYVGESPEASTFHPGSLGSMRGSNNMPRSVGFISHNIFPHVGGNCMELSMPQKNGLQLLHPMSTLYNGRGHCIPIMNSIDSPHERARSRRNEGSINQADKKQFELDIDCIIRGEDKRTTLMLKNIPNKYTSKMLLAAIDERHRGTYDFIYLPIDFKNKCNVGYAFINMIDPSQIITFYQAFNGKKWEKFNSEKVASLAYARIQGKAALIAHFQNSSLMNEDKRCRPILFNTDGPNAGDQVPFPMGVNVRTRPGKARSTCQEENNLESHSYSENEDNSSTGESCSSRESS